MSAAWTARRSGRVAAIILLASAATLLESGVARAWDSRVHKLIVRMAIAALPQPIHSGFEMRSPQLQEFAVEPDTVLRGLYGQAEGRRHYIDLENFGADPWAALQPDFGAMKRRYGEAMLDRTGTLPWAIQDEAAAMRDAWRSGDCDTMLRHAGYLAHYVGDASQPLHTTRYYDGYTRAERGEHSRLESSADRRVDELEAETRGKAHAEPVTSVWSAIIPELRQSNALVPQLAQNDQTARSVAGYDLAAYTDALMRTEQNLIAHQLIDGASVLASVWVFEYEQAAKPTACLDGASERAS